MPSANARKADALLSLQSDLFQDDLYPDTAGPEAAMEAEEWVAGKTAPPILISLREAYVPTKQRDFKVNRRSLLPEGRPAAPSNTGLSATPSSAMTPSTATSALSVAAAASGVGTVLLLGAYGDSEGEGPDGWAGVSPTGLHGVELGRAGVVGGRTKHIR